jgi:predicted transcriptional regulator
LLSLQKEREEYEVIVEKGRLVFRQDGRLVNTDEKSKWIFVLSTTRALYVGKKQKGKFQHSSFLAGGATTAAGRLVAHQGVLEVLISICTPHFYKDLINTTLTHIFNHISPL